MADLATLRSRLATALRDEAFDTWPSDEMDDILTDTVASLYPRIAVPMSLPIYPLTADTEIYDVPSGIREVYRIEVGEVATDLLVRVLDGAAWYTYDDPLDGSLKVFVNKSYSDPDHYYIVHGFGAYSISGSNEIPDMHIPLVVAMARAEAYRRMIGERARFEQWQASSHEQDVTVNELLALTAEAHATADILRERAPRNRRRPVPGRLPS